MTDYVVSVKQALVPLVNGRTVIVSRGYQVPAEALPATVTHLLAIGAIEAGEGAAIGGIGPDLDGEGNPIGAAPSPTPPPYVRTVNGDGPDVAGNVEAGGSSFPDFTGSGSPEGVVTADVGKSYVDTTNGGLYWKIDGTGDTGWAAASVTHSTGPPAPGTYVQLGHDGALYLLGKSGPHANVMISDADSYSDAGTGNGIYWNGADGQQYVRFLLGDSSQFHTQFKADGTAEFPGDVKVAALAGVVLQAPNGSLHRIKVANDGTLSTEVVT
jgi:hypothetical protein